MSFVSFLLAYLLGGFTFIPLVIAAVLAHAHYTFPHRPDVLDPVGALVDDDAAAAAEPAIGKPRSLSWTRDRDSPEKARDRLVSAPVVGEDRPAPVPDSSLHPAAEKEQQQQAAKQWRGHQSNVAAGYFAVCREYMPMGINAKPIERSTPAGSATVAAPSQSVYQAMYRTIFERKQTPGPLDDRANFSQRPKKAGNVFYVVLRCVGVIAVFP